MAGKKSNVDNLGLDLAKSTFVKDPRLALLESGNISDASKRDIEEAIVRSAMAKGELDKSKVEGNKSIIATAEGQRIINSPSRNATVWARAPIETTRARKANATTEEEYRHTDSLESNRDYEIAERLYERGSIGVHATRRQREILRGLRKERDEKIDSWHAYNANRRETAALAEREAAAEKSYVRDAKREYMQTLINKRASDAGIVLSDNFLRPPEQEDALTEIKKNAREKTIADFNAADKKAQIRERDSLVSNETKNKYKDLTGFNNQADHKGGVSYDRSRGWLSQLFGGTTQAAAKAGKSRVRRYSYASN